MRRARATPMPLMGRGPGPGFLRRTGFVGGVATTGSVKSRLGVKGGLRGQPAVSTGVKSRLGPRGKPGVITDARQKLNMNRIKGGRVTKSSFSDARNKIQANRLLGSPGVGKATTTTGGAGALLRSTTTRGTFGANEPIRNLIITTPNPSARGGLFQNAVSGIEQEWGGYSYGFPTATPPAKLYQHQPEPILTRTISNNLHYSPPKPPTRQAPSFGSPRGISSSLSSSAARDRYGTMRSDYVGSTRDDDYMDIDRPAAPIRRTLQSRLDPLYKVRVSNLQQSVTVEDVAELFSDIGDLLDVKSLGPGVAEAYYRTKSDCLKAVETYHNRLLDGRPMLVVLDDKESSSRPSASSNLRISNVSLKSAAGATSAIKLPKASSSAKIQPDLSAIHKVLFTQPSSVNATKMLFKGGH